MSAFCKHCQLNTKTLLGFLLPVFFFSMVWPVNAANLFNEQISVIVIDPGHGGNDTGVKGTDNSREKNITLAMAHLLKDRLSGNFKTILTRKDDYALDIYDRAAVANTNKASIFISLHVGGSFQHKNSGISIYYFQNPSSDEISLDHKRSGLLLEDRTVRAWKSVQLSHIIESKKLAQTIYTSLSEQQHLGVKKSQDVNLSVLAGADMPAVIIEIGYLTNPSDESKLNDFSILKDLSHKLSIGIEKYLTKN
ncbi:MAG: N-acetylmuramoyl-L-alanine amidase [Desulfobacterales bacterium]|nr:N-acetylmuramoyl-L-alanine amidase [Desulfobacterales bacterium]